MLERDLTNVAKIKPTDNLPVGSTIDIPSAKNSLTSSASAITFTISCEDDDITLEVILGVTSAVYTFPAPALCISEGVASANNTCTLTGAVGDKYIIGIKRVSGTNYVACKNFLH